ncbi:neuroplastin-like [Saccoglossus kowalevskii]|uniref:Neuroplastin-like n=1 Tax=Saccoglossus kowalevskii TaxID=10224 RepID=A0ABM0GZZ1_SACKO|nr:PREDICTED: neuroplastin-like [Saccoglossus kowalevskii]
MTTKPEDPIIEVKKAENITIYCATNGRDVEWEKNGVKINGTDLDKDGDNDVLVKENNTLIIVNSEVTDAGVYSCFIEHILDGKSLIEKESVEIQAVVAVELEQSVNLEEGETAHIKCEIQGYPVPSVVWYKESEESGTVELVNGTEKGRVWISVEVKPEMIISTLIIKSVQHEDRALYNCTAANDYTYDSEECMLRVKDRLAALWPFIGILIEVVVLCAIILICEKRQKGKQAQDEDDDELPSKKLNDNSSKEADIRLRNINS